MTMMAQGFPTLRSVILSRLLSLITLALAVRAVTCGARKARLTYSPVTQFRKPEPLPEAS